MYCLLLQGFAYVKYNNSISAASAVERYNGFELPAGSGLRLKVSSAVACYNAPLSELRRPYRHGNGDVVFLCPAM